MKRIICWFSCGAASAVATKLAIAANAKAAIAGMGQELVIVYQDTGSEHPDNARFKDECEAWFGQPIETIKAEKYNNVDDVIKKTRYIAGVGGARCTTELKRKVAENYISFGNDTEVFGYTREEQTRVNRFIEQNNERDIWPILCDKQIGKSDCYAMLERAGIELPAMYKLGYRNNNCIGCVKGQAGYWNKIKTDFPEVFAIRAAQERELNVAINKKYVDGKRVRVFLDELPTDMGNYPKESDISCGIMCVIAEEEYKSSDCDEDQVEEL